ncbi:FecCD family ABC transporter permease [Photobacterium sanguinicancri]|uniref:Iron chelate uptake ABC transporter family permease subunit n=1 Tax=Photobacterium sanguinicancri TaxID=875932 RepID=A0AAW7Y5A9_9GAMM|nr:iron chelate uptake ABC transporter family permease subunit [Photobacterium sanguinicancri]MDO6542669.1 iron chelate uptake ABC transporter family permease subunit [Photobacterium sanguinicancri]
MKTRTSDYIQPLAISFSLFIIIVFGFAASMLSWSSFSLKLHDLQAYLFAFDNTNIEQQILATLRAPRAYAALMIGANLAVAGAIMQGLTRNALASPSVLGINAGAACFMALASIQVPILSQLPSVLVAAVGGVASGLLVMLLGGFFSERPHPLKLVLAGIAINALLIGLTRAAVILADDMAYSVMHWLTGSLSGVDWEQWRQLWPSSVVGLCLAFYIARNLNLLSLGDDVATGLGLNIRTTRTFACVSIVLLTGSSVAIAGPIGFVGLLIPHIAKKLVGSNFLVLLPVSALCGATLVCWADALSRGIAFPSETPVGVITALIGTPCFIMLALRNKLS